jgi:CPA2 family monovalent cation:H+ antiporter-2
VHDLGFLRDLLIAFALGGAVVYLLRPIKVPSLVGLLVAGVMLGPHGLSLITDTKNVEILAEIGIVLLLFTIGLELSIGHLVGMWRTLLLGGGAQVLLTVILISLAASAVGIAAGGKALFFGCLVSLSSTAIVLALLGQKGELATPVGRASLGVLLFQDLCIVPLMLLAPFLAGQGGGAREIATTVAAAVGVVAGVVIAARRLVPALLFHVVRTRSRELFLTLIMVLCLGTAYLTSLAGLSLALGAFLAGLAISESEYSHQALAEAIPFRDAFAGLFFMSIGMLMDVRQVAAAPLRVAGIVGVIIVLKLVSTSLPLVLLGHSARSAVLTAFVLAQVGEFAFVLAHSGQSLGLLTPAEYQVFLAASVITMLLTPPLRFVGGAMASKLNAERPLVPWAQAPPAELNAAEQLADHVVIVGYGVNGRNLARALRSAGVRYAILELNPETVRRARAEGEPIEFGDSTRQAILHRAGIARARVLVVAISDAAATRATVSLAREEGRQAHIVVRTRYVAEIDELKQLGADDVIPEEFETSIEIFSRVLHHYDVPRNVWLDLSTQVRDGMYEMLRAPAAPQAPRSDAALHSLEGIPTETLCVRAGSEAAGETLRVLDLRARTGASVIALRRGGSLSANPSPDTVLEAGDVVVVIGERTELDAALLLFDPEAPPSSEG